LDHQTNLVLGNTVFKQRDNEHPHSFDRKRIKFLAEIGGHNALFGANRSDYVHHHSGIVPEFRSKKCNKSKFDKGSISGQLNQIAENDRKLRDKLNEAGLDKKELEKAQTHDPYWNAAQKEMLLTGKTHNYMRMYWGKKIMEWSATPEVAFKRVLYLNNKYELDGRDPNSFTGVAWCFGKHDRPWTERPIFGTVRYMNASGLERKFDMEAYVQKIENLQS